MSKKTPIIVEQTKHLPNNFTSLSNYVPRHFIIRERKKSRQLLHYWTSFHGTKGNILDLPLEDGSSKASSRFDCNR